MSQNGNSTISIKSNHINAGVGAAGIEVVIKREVLREHNIAAKYISRTKPVLSPEQ